MSDELKRYYLQAMGVDVWLQRQDKPACSGRLAALAQEAAACTRCALHNTRKQSVFFRGDLQARLMVVGEAPGYYEDQQGKPFVGKAGQLLNRMLHSVGLSENEVYIANLVKCRPPENRNPEPAEIQQCSSYLVEQIALVNPVLIVGLGQLAGQFLAQNTHAYNQIPFRVSYHPAHLLRNPVDKKKAYQDWLAIRDFLA